MEFRTMLEKGVAIKGSQAALAKAIGESEQNTAGAKAGRRGLKDESCAALADLLGLSFGEVIAARNYALAKSDKERQFWSPFVMGRKAASFTAISAAIGLLTTAPSPANATTTGFMTFAQTIMCIM